MSGTKNNVEKSLRDLNLMSKRYAVKKLKHWFVLPYNNMWLYWDVYIIAHKIDSR